MTYSVLLDNCHQEHPYCDPIRNQDYSWNFLVDELREIFGKWQSRAELLQVSSDIQKIGYDCSPEIILITTTTETTTTTEGQLKIW